MRWNRRKREIFLSSAIILSVTGMVTAAAEDKQSNQAGKTKEDYPEIRKTLKQYDEYLLNLEFEKLKSLYADKVIVRKRARLLKKGLKEKGEAFGKLGDRTVTSAQLVEALENFVDSQGRETWKSDAKFYFEEGPREVVLYDREHKLYETLLKMYRAEKGDVFVVLDPKRNWVFLQFRRINNQWKIVSEEWF